MSFFEQGYFINYNSFGTGQSLVMVAVTLIVLFAYLFFFKWSKTIMYALLIEFGIGVYLTILLLIYNVTEPEATFWLTRGLYTAFLVQSIVAAYGICHANPYIGSYLKYYNVIGGGLLIGTIYMNDGWIVTRVTETVHFSFAIKGPYIGLIFLFMFFNAGVLIVELIRLWFLDRKIFYNIWPLFIGIIFLVIYANYMGIRFRLRPDSRLYLFVNAMVFTLLLMIYLAKEVKRTVKERDDILRRFSTDDLTGIHSRSYIFDQIERKINGRNYKRCMVAVIDLDGFKMINDTYGHKAGDDVLIAFGQLLNHRREDEILSGRIGGDEFLLFFQGMDASEIRGYLERLKTDYRMLVQAYDTEDKRMGLSIGVAKFEAGSTVDEVIAYADERMYRDKTGKGENSESKAVFD